ncbi:Transglycosylase-associated protein [Candidatus Burkholderia pumila]|uniref:Transglycosylase-associated protein n=1 Tax=Candidatus Burkholderia pumila TaxID=1090375 RepID=A0ABR5HKW4_9BURK|nr:Transglycosylase-associated protein [Candidatus Burkholderia pumila]
MQLMQHGIVIALIIGGVAGWLAYLIMNGSGFGVLVDILVGIVGGVFGNWLFGLIGFSFGGGIFGTLLTAIIGAVVLFSSSAWWFVADKTSVERRDPRSKVSPFSFQRRITASNGGSSSTMRRAPRAPRLRQSPSARLRSDTA